MKIKPEHIEHMRVAMQAVLDSSGFTYSVVEQDYIRKGLSDKRCRWDLFNMAGLTRWVCDTIYPYANDEHVDTALRHIVKGFK